MHSPGGNRKLFCTPDSCTAFLEFFASCCRHRRPYLSDVSSVVIQSHLLSYSLLLSKAPSSHLRSNNHAVPSLSRNRRSYSRDRSISTARIHRGVSCPAHIVDSLYIILDRLFITCVVVFGVSHCSGRGYWEHRQAKPCRNNSQCFAFC